MNPYIQLALGCFLLSAVIAHMMWTRSRVWVFRQDLFLIRDLLWDKMRTKGMLDDSLHLETRAAINGMIRLAPRFSLITLAIMLAKGVHRESQPFEIVECKAAMHDVVHRTMHYAVNQTITGRLLRLAAVIISAHLVMMRQIRTWIERFVGSSEIKHQWDH